MCCISAAYSTLGTYCAFLVYNPTSTEKAQPSFCGVLVSFLIVGAFFLNYIRVKFDQANVGGMLSAVIMTLSLTGAVLQTEWVATNVLTYLIPCLVGFGTMFVVNLVLSPENSTTVYIQELIKVLNTFDKISCDQFDGFFQSQQGSLNKKNGERLPPLSPAAVHTQVDQLLVSLIDKKRTVRREIAFNAISPVDINEMTKIVKRLCVPIQGICTARVMEANVRQMDLILQATQSIENKNNNNGIDIHKIQNEELYLARNNVSDSSLDIPTTTASATTTTIEGNSNNIKRNNSKNEVQLSLKVARKQLLQMNAARSDSFNSNQNGFSVQSSGSNTTSPSIKLEESAYVHSCSRQEYIKVLNKCLPIYMELMTATSKTIIQIIKRLRRLQNIDPYYQDKPFFYKYIFPYRHPIDSSSSSSSSNMNSSNNNNTEYKMNVDPSIALFDAIQRFDSHRLDGLNKLFNEGHYPKRSLLLILKFQFSLRTYAEMIYTLSSLIYEMDQVRTHRRIWIPKMTFKNIFTKNREVTFDLDAPAAMNQHISGANLQRFLSHHTALMQSMYKRKESLRRENTIHEQDDHLEEEDQVEEENGGQCSYSKDVKVITNDSGVSNNDSDDDSDDDDDDSSSSSSSSNSENIDYQSLEHALEKKHHHQHHSHKNKTQFNTKLPYPIRGQVMCIQEKGWFHQHRPKKHMIDQQQQQHQGRPPLKRNLSSIYHTTISKKVSKWRQQILHRSKVSTPLDPTSYHDPDASYPETRTQLFFYHVWQFGHSYIYTSDTAFALRATILVAFLTLPGFLEDSYEWYNHSRGQWAAIVAIIWIAPSVGSSFFGTMVRTIGTFSGGAVALIIWEICGGRMWPLIFVTFIFNIPFYTIYALSTFWRATGMFSLITTSIILGYGYVNKMTDTGITVYDVTYQRIVAVLVGVFSAMLVSIFPYAHTSRVEVRHRISHMLNDIGALYAAFLGLLLKGSLYEYRIKESNQKLFRTFAINIRQQIKITRTLMEQSRFEPLLRGTFPEKKYLKLLQVLDNILNLMLQMEMALHKMNSDWRLSIINETWGERKTMISSILTSLQLASNALINKAPLPPYIIRPTKARRVLTDKVRKLPIFQMDNLDHPEYTFYSAYLMNSEQLAVEIEVLIATIRDLVGPDSISVWFEYIH
ncbi:unnamed protein product [Cunninghamella blakesleeana]